MNSWIAVVKNVNNGQLRDITLGSAQGSPGELIARHARNINRDVVHPSFYFRADEEEEILAFLQRRAEARKKNPPQR